MQPALSRNSDDVIVLDIDPFDERNLLDPFPYQEQIRETAPFVWLSKYGVWATARHQEATAVLTDWKRFCSSAGVGLANFKTEKPWRPPSLVLEHDPPAHTFARAILSRALAPAPLRKLRAQFEREAEKQAARLLELGTFDAIAELATGYPLKVFGDAIGIATDEREIILEYGNMSFNAMGPRNRLAQESLKREREVTAWIMGRCQRAALTSDGLGAIIYQAVDEGEVSEEQGAMLVRSFLSAGIDTTVRTIGTGLYWFAREPQQWQLLRARPELVRPAIEEILRIESPFQTVFRTTAAPTEISGVQMQADQKILISIGGGNRDTRKWPDADKFDIVRGAAGHLGFGAGIHGCLGQMLARLEIEVLLAAVARKVRTIELAGKPDYLLNNTVRGFGRLPVRFGA